MASAAGKGKQKELMAAFSEIALRAAVEHVAGWIETLGKYGKLPQPGEKNDLPAATRINAAAKGIDFVSKLIPNVSEAGPGAGLLAELSRLEETSTKLEDESAGEEPVVDPDE